MNQIVFALGPKPLPAEVSNKTLAKQADMLGAINLSAAESGLNSESIYPCLGMEKASFSKCMSGSNHFPAEHLDKFCDVVGNEIPLRWWAQKRGYKLVKLQSTIEEELAESRQENADLKRDMATIIAYNKAVR